MDLPIETAKIAGYLTLVPAYGRDYKSKREVIEAWDAGKDFIIQDMSSRWDGKPINKSDAKSSGIQNVNIRYKGMRSVAVIKVAKTAFGEKMKSATESEFHMALRNAPHARKRHIDGGPRTMDVEWSDRGTVVASKTIIYTRGKVSQEMYMANSEYLPGGSMARQARFPEGEKMTVEEVAEVVGPEFKEMNEDPPESVKDLREDMEEAMGADDHPWDQGYESTSRLASGCLPVERAALMRVAEVRPGQKFVIVETSVPGGRWMDDIIYDGTREADRVADKIRKSRPKAMWAKYPYDAGVQVIDAVWFGPAEAKLRALGMRAASGLSWERRASEQRAEKLEAEAEANEAQADADREKADAASDKAAAGGLYGYTKGTQRDVEVTIRKAQRHASKLAKTLHAQDHQAIDFLKIHAKRSYSKTARLLIALMEECPKVDLLPIEQVKQAEDIPMGMYGYPTHTARLALDACSAFRAGIGEVAYTLPSRHMAKHGRIMSFLKEHSKTTKCGYTRLLLDTYPEAPRLAAKKKLPEELEKHQFTSEDNPNPKGNDKDGDGETNEPSPLKDKKAVDGGFTSPHQMLRKAFVPDSVDGWLEWGDGTRTAVSKNS
mgnify:FL=1